jgi:hypothetical protein
MFREYQQVEYAFRRIFVKPEPADRGHSRGILHELVVVQARLNGLVASPLGGAPILQPQSMPNGSTLCAGPGRHTVSKSWFVRLNGGATTSTFSIWWKLVDLGIPNSMDVYASLTNRTVKLTQYN